MEYTGRLYGKFQGTYFETGKTSKDYDNLITLLEETKNAYECWIEEQNQGISLFIDKVDLEHLEKLNKALLYNKR